MTLTPSQEKQLAGRGIGAAEVERQLSLFASGFPSLTILAAATPGHGITLLSPSEEEAASTRWGLYLAQGGTVVKFVPASGAASRMFKALFEFADGDSDEAPEGSAVAALLAALDKLPFAKDLDEACIRLHGKDAAGLLADGRRRDVVAAIIRPEGLNYGQLPKGLLKFHSYPDGARTPLEEHLMEGAQTAADADGTVKLHFTVSANHVELFKKKIAEAVPAMEKATGKKFEVSLSVQQPKTDTVAANPDGSPFLVEEGRFLFRPGGHGALIANLSEQKEAVVFVKNIDNVAPDSRRASTVHYKKVLAGYLMELHDKVCDYRRAIATGVADGEKLAEMVDFLAGAFCIEVPVSAKIDNESLAKWIDDRLNRPMRVCGMVANEGEPGGGPFVVADHDGSSSLQILESHQIAPEYAAIAARATHFNPVDLVCYIRDTEGRPFDLSRYVDPTTGFISSKSYAGRELRALELPGLWNGAMSRWLTAFVEVPASTFNPVKTVNDLLRPAHQG
ncbi:MAG: DUF4301 family protein [Pseudoflavonifractor sp.]|nr:DUF4301 family protein [Alloprevotella sp.]MCM1117418.1 DUF4301 family protein [Pseudoflavonifractor sp.]